MRFKAVWIGAMLLAAALGAPAQTLNLDVDLRQLEGREYLRLIRAAVPEVHGGRAEKPLDLSQLATLHTVLKNGRSWPTPSDERKARHDQRILERLMRKQFSVTSLPDLQAMALGDGRTHGGNYSLRPALYLRLVEAEVASILQEPKRALRFPPSVATTPDVIARHMPARGLDQKELLRAHAPFAALRAKAEKEPRAPSRSDEEFDKVADPGS